MFDKLKLGLLAGTLAGSLVGIAEALWVLTSAGAASDTLALFYATVLYGGIGLGMGAAVGVGLAVLGRLMPSLSRELAWTLGFFGVFAPLGMVIARYYANKVVYAEAGVPMSGNLAILALFGGLFGVGLLVFPRLLSRTPLKVLRELKGAGAAWGALALVTAVFSFAPGADPDGELAPARAQGPEFAGRPDVLLLVVDTLRADHLGAYGAGSEASPALDALAADGVVFEQAHAQASWTRSSFATIYSSMVPSGHKAALKSSLLPDEVETLAEVLSGGGYVTGGLPNNTNVTRSFNFHQGFDYFHYMAPDMPFWATESVYQLSMYSVLRKVGERLKGANKVVTDFYQPAPAVADKARAFIEAQGDTRWFLMMHLMEPHDPYFERPYNGVGYGRAEHEVPEADKVDYLRGLYRAEIAAMDAELAPFLEWLRSTGRYDDMMIIVTADHGEEFLDHGGWWHGTTLYEEQIRIPLIVKLPGQALAGTRAPWLVRHIDIAPTIAAAAGMAPGAAWQGADLLDEAARSALAPAPAEAPAPPSEGEAVEGEAVEQAAPFDPRSLDRPVLAEEDFEGNQIVAWMQGDWKLIKANEGNPRGLSPLELYDMKFDPGETKNVATGNGGTVNELSEASRAAISRALSGGVTGQEAEMSAADEERLRALGYIE